MKVFNKTKPIPDKDISYETDTEYMQGWDACQNKYESQMVEINLDVEIFSCCEDDCSMGCYSCFYKEWKSLKQKLSENKDTQDSTKEQQID